MVVNLGRCRRGGAGFGQGNWPRALASESRIGKPPRAVLVVVDPDSDMWSAAAKPGGLRARTHVMATRAWVRCDQSICMVCHEFDTVPTGTSVKARRAMMFDAARAGRRPIAGAGLHAAQARS